MTVTMTCERSGIQFEAESRRTKVHPKISALLNELYKDGKPGAYGVATKALASFKSMEVKPEIETILAEVVFAVEEHNGVVSQETRRNRELAAQREEARRQRYLTNAKLRKHGYRWQRNSGEDLDAIHAAATYEEPQSDWRLIAPDGREVTVAQALTEIG